MAARFEVLVVYKKSQLELALEKHNTRIKRLLKRADPSVRAMQVAHDAHRATLDAVRRALDESDATFRFIYRARLRRSAAAKASLVVSVGGDGTMLDASHKLVDTPALGVNSDPVHSIGFLCASDATTFAGHLAQVMARSWTPTPVRRLTGNVDGVKLPFPVMNDVLVAHKNPAATSRYLLDHRGTIEDHKSSGIWISTAAGSTAALSAAGGAVFDLDDERAQLVVREPFEADREQLSLTSFVVDNGDVVRVTSKMREGRVYLDGPHEIVDLPTGAVLTIADGAPPLRLYVTDEMRRRRNEVRSRRTP